MADKLCPLLKEPCIEHRCAWYTQILGEHPQGKKIEEWGCAIAWMPVLQIENAKETRHAAAAVESARNEAQKDAARVGASVLQLAEAVAAQGRPVPGELLEVREARPRFGVIGRLFKRG